MIGYLPQKLKVGTQYYKIRSDYRDVLKILAAFGDSELTDEEKIYVCLFILYKDFTLIPQELYEDAFKEAISFIDNGMKSESKKQMRVMDWEQDEPILFPAINKVAGFETRRAKYIHWWTFLGYYMEISEGVFSHIIGMRLKKAKGKKLEKAEREYWNANLAMCRLTVKLSEEEQQTKNRLNEMLG